MPFNLFKKKEEKKPEEVKPVAVPERVRVETKRRSLPAKQVLFSPCMTEKSTALAEKNQYVFKVYPSSNKTEIKKAVETLYGVEVVGVRIINVPAKKRQKGNIRGWKKGYKKALVKLQEGQKIDIATT